MWPVIGGLLGGLGSFFGAEQTNTANAQNVAATNAANAQMQQQAETFNAGQTQQQESFQQSMSNTAYQRASSDMQAAGLNPMMMFGSGSAASSPGGSAASISPVRMQAPQYQSPLSTVADSVSHVVNSAVAAKTMDKMTDEIANLQATRQKVEAETLTEQQRQSLTFQQAENEAAKTQQNRYGIITAANAARTAQSEQSLPDWLRTSLDVGGFAGARVNQAISPVASVLHGANSAANFGYRWGQMMRGD